MSAPNDFIGHSFDAATINGFKLSRWIWNRDSEPVRPHGHAEAHIMVITSGPFITMAKGDDSPQGPVVFNPEQTYHADSFADNGSFFSISIDHWRSRESEEFRLPSEPTRIRSIASRAIIREIMMEMAAGRPDSGPIVEALCVELLGSAGAAELSERHPPAWLKMAACMLEEAADDPTIDALAAAVKAHPIHLARTFRRFYRMTPGQYRRSVKLRRALALLCETRLPLAEIAVEAGFVDQPHLTRLFKQTYGTTPGALRGLDIGPADRR